MIKTLIVDDDFLVRMFLKQITDWEAAGFALIEDACNGKEAYSIIEKEMPELIITDLSMPVMDGITLIEKIRAISADIYIVALSCHDEFEYVKEAMRLGADEYILKNLLDEESLKKILDSVRAKISKTEAIRHEKDELRRLAKKGSDQLLQELLEELIANPRSFEDQRMLCQSVGVTYQFRRCVAIVTYAEQISGHILQPICEQFGRNKNSVCLGRIANSVYLLLDLSEMHSQADQLDAINTFADGLKNCIFNYLNVKGSIGISGINGGEGGICTALWQAKKALEYHFYGSKAYRYNELPLNTKIPDEAKALNDLFRSGTDLTDEELYQLSITAFDLLKKSMVDPVLVKSWFKDLLESGSYNETIPETIDNMETLWLSITVNIKKKDVIVEPCNNRAISQAVNYIQKHYHEPISLQQVAQEVHLNATYLSHLFKQEMGVNFIDYLTGCRLNRIKTLLQERNRSIKECASLAGFQDYRNFCKLFKKETGMRPAEYRNLKI